MAVQKNIIYLDKETEQDNSCFKDLRNKDLSREQSEVRLRRLCGVNLIHQTEREREIDLDLIQA